MKGEYKMEETNENGLDDVIIIDPTNTQAIDAIFGGEETDPDDDGNEPDVEGGKFIDNNNKDNDSKKEHTEGNAEDADPESVGDGTPPEEEESEGGKQENAEEAAQEPGSPDISSIAKAFREEGLLFATLDEKRVSEIIPEASGGQHSNLSTIGFAVGFVLMMVLDVVMG